MGAAVVGEQAVHAVDVVGRAVIQYLAQGGGQVLDVRRRAALDDETISMLETAWLGIAHSNGAQA
ncbi:MAG: hypothetical protein MI924_23485 [Chloroflexales bacterium]|nr:hypothetical protein [Chloroflexales bacterium]